jgi:hypothetical protein
MSYHYEFIAKTKEGAHKHLARRQLETITALPEDVWQYLSTALTNMRYEGAVHVKAAGHLCGPDLRSYERTSAEILVEPLDLGFVDE